MLVLCQINKHFKMKSLLTLLCLVSVGLIFTFHSCKKESVPEQGKLTASAQWILIYHHTVEFSIFLTNVPEVNDTWRITKLPFFLVSEQMSGTINKSIAEIKLKFNTEINIFEDYSGYIEILSEKSGSLIISVSYQPYAVVDIEVIPASLHFSTQDTIRSMKFRNNSHENIWIEIYPQYNWITTDADNNNTDFLFIGVDKQSEKSISLFLDQKSDNLSLGLNTNKLVLSIRRAYSDDIAELFAYEITADIPPIKDFRTIQNSLTFDYGDSIALIKLTNDGNSPLDWSSVSIDGFLSLEPAFGTIDAKEIVDVHVKIDRSNFDQYDYTSSVQFNWDEGLVEIPVTIYHDPGHWKQFPYYTAIEYVKLIDKIVLINEAKEFIIYEPETENQINIPSLQGATGFEINEEGTYAVVSMQNQIIRLNLMTLETDYEHTLPNQLKNYKLYGENTLYYYAYNFGATVHHHYLNLTTSETTPYILSPHAYILEKHPDQPMLYLNNDDYFYTYNINTSPGLLVDRISINTYDGQRNWKDFNNNMIFDRGQVFSINNPPDFLPELVTQIEYENDIIEHVYIDEELRNIFLVYDKIRVYNPDNNYAFVRDYNTPLFVKKLQNGDYVLKDLTSLFCFTRENSPYLYVVARESSYNYKLTKLLIE
jgi:hypothetical protein